MGATVLIAITILGNPIVWPEGVVPPPARENPGYLETARPLWLESALAANRNAAERYGHTLDVKQLPGPPFLPQQTAWCEQQPADKPSGPYNRRKCYQGAHRNNCTWYKFRQILEYLLANAAEYILFIDCDAFIMLRQDHDPVARMIETMNTEAVDIMVADEDWRGAVGETNTGVVLVRNCNWSITFFTEILQMQANNVCKTNEQACFRSLVAQDHNHAKTHVHVDSGLKWNRHPSDRRDRGNVKMDWDTNPATEIVHFMGGAKPGLEKIDVPDNGVCSGEDTGRTAQTRCIDVDHCALVSTVRRAGVPQGKRAFVLVEPLDNPPGQRFLDVAAMRAALEMAKAASADAVYIVPQTGVARYPLTAAERTVLRSRGFTLHEVPWVSPTDAPTPLREACGGRGFLSIHALALESYVTVIVLGPGVVAQQKAQSLFDCSGGDSKASRLLHAGNLVTRLAAIQPSSAVFTAVFKAVTLLSLTAARRNGTDCGLALVVALLCDPQHASAIGGGKCQPLDVCKWARTAHDDAPCSAVGIPCTSSRVMMADACR